MTAPDLAAAFETVFGRPLDTGYRADVEAVEPPDAWLADVDAPTAGEERDMQRRVDEAAAERWGRS